MWYLRWKRDHVTRIQCYIFSEIFLLTMFFTGTHKDKTIGLQQGKSLVLTRNKDSNLKREWASERNLETRPKLQCMNRTVSLCLSAPGTSSFTALTGDHPKPYFQADYKRFALSTQKVFVSQLSSEHWWESIHLAAFCWKQLQSASNAISPWWSG